MLSPNLIKHALVLSNLYAKLGFSTDKVQIARLADSLYNQNFLVSQKNRKLVFKCYSGEITGSWLSNNPQTEFKTISLLNRYQIAPKPVFFDDTGKIFSCPVLVYEFVPGRINRFFGKSLEQTALTLHRLHSVPVQKAPFLKKVDHSIPALIKNIRQRQRVCKKRYPKSQEVKKFAQFFESIQKNWKDYSYKPSVLHLDLAPENVLQSKNRVVLLDWQGPVLGDKAFDVWSFASDIFQSWNEYRLSARQKQRFFEKYAELTSDSKVLERIQAKAPFWKAQLGFYSYNRYQEYIGGRLPKQSIQIRMHRFEKFKNLYTAALNSLYTEEMTYGNYQKTRH